MSRIELPGTADPYDDAEISQVLQQLALLSETVKYEFDLISGRMSVLMIAESFIFSGFAMSAANYQKEHLVSGVLTYLIWITPVLGMVLAACVYAAILAAHSAVHKLKDQRELIIRRLPSHLQIDLISSRSVEQWWGNLQTHVVPSLLFLVWAGAMTVLVLDLLNPKTSTWS